MPDQERQEMTRVNSGASAKVSSLSYQIQDTVARRDRELAAALKEYQEQVVNGHLHKVRISDASLPGIGPQLKQRLAVAGFVSAGDIGTRRYENVPGIGAKKWAVLHDWRRQLEGPIRTREAPNSLPSHKSSVIEQRYEAQIVPLQRSLAQEQLNLVVAQQANKTRFTDQKRTLEQQKSSAETTLHQQTAVIDKKFNDQRKLIATDEHDARSRAQRASDDCRSQCRVTATQLQQEGDRIKQDYKMSLDRLNQEIEKAAKQVREVVWRQDQMGRRYSAYGFLSFREYLLRLTRKS